MSEGTRRTAAHRQRLRSSAVGRDGYVRVHPTWSGSTKVAMGDAPGIGRQIGWLLGAMVGAPIMLAVSNSLPFWQILLGIAACSIVGAIIGHVIAKLVWSKVAPKLPARNPRPTPARDLTVGTWMMTQNDGTNRAIRVEAAPVSIPDPLAESREPQDTVSVLTSTGRDLVLPADQTVTVVDLDIPSDPQTRS